MISLKRYLDQISAKQASGSLPLSLEGYQTMLNTVADGALRCCPSIGENLEKEFLLAIEPLNEERTPRVFKHCQDRVLKSLRVWGEQSEAYFSRKTTEVKEMLTELASTAESIGKRDQRYAQQFHEITANLESIAQLDDLSRIQMSVLRSAGELKGCIERMAREGNESIAQLEASLASRRLELKQARDLAALDPLTGLYNRREVEARLGRKLDAGTPFCVVLVSLRQFKQINQRHGLPVGDELLRQIAHELRMASRAEDTLGRWGGDEFLLMLDGSLTSARVKMQRMRPWVFGNYDLEMPDGKVSVVVNASIGIAESTSGESPLEILSRAHADMSLEEVAHS